MLKAFQSLHGYKTSTKSVSLPSFADIGLYRTESKQSKRQFWILVVVTNCSHPSVIPAWQIGNLFFFKSSDRNATWHSSCGGDNKLEQA